MTLQISPVDVNYSVDPVTGDITFHNPDGSTSVLRFNPDTGTYSTTSASGVSNSNEFAQGMLHSGLSAIDDQGNSIAAAMTMIAQLSGDDARVSYLQQLMQNMQNYSESLANGGNNSQAAGELFQNLASALENHRQGLSEHLNATGQSLIDKAQTSLRNAEAAARAAAQSGSEASLIEARYANAGAILDAVQLLNALSEGDTGGIAKATFGVAAGVIAGSVLGFFGAPLAAGLLAGLAVGFAADWFYDEFLADYFKDLGNFWDNLYGYLDGLFGDLKNSTYRIQRYDPLALDLNGDGVVSTRADGNLSGPLFDFDADGYRTATGWVSGEDGLLVRDLNSNGTIDSGAELFGDQTLLRDGSVAATGFQALADLDANADGVVDSNDAAFASLRIWQDANQNGVTNAGELKTLTELGITSLSVAHNIESTNVAGGQRTGTGSFTRTDEGGNAATQVMQEFDFDSDTIRGAYTTTISVSSDLNDIPTIPGVGRMRSLREACALSPALTQLVRQFMAAGTRGEQEQLMPALLQEWVKTNPGYSSHGIQAYTGGAVQDPNSTNVVFLRPGESLPIQVPADLPDAQVQAIRVAEAVLGIPAQDVIYWANDNTNIYHNVYVAFQSEVYKQLSYQTRLKPYVDKIAFVLDAQGGFAIDIAPAFAMLNQLHATNQDKARSELAEFLVYIKGVGLSNESSLPGAELLRNWLSTDALTPTQLAEITSIGVIYQDGSANQPQSTSGNDVIIVKSTASVGAYSQGGAGMDTLYGDVGNDTLGGGEGNDQLLGAAGNDSLSGGAGNDALYGGTGSDQLYGENGNDRLLGGDGADNLIAGDGNDTLSGGAGDDYLYGGNGEDIYLFGRGDGHDVLNNYGYQQNAPKGALVLGSGIAATDIKMWRSGNYLCISILGTTDRIDIAEYFEADATGAYTVKEIRFADGTVWDVNYVKAVVLAATDGDDDIYGYDTDDVLAGGPSNDHLSGRGGNDVLNGGLGNDSLDGGKGNDQLNGEDGADYLAGGEGADILSGGAGTDTLADEDGDDIVDGGADADTLYSYGTGNDTFRFGRSSGADTLYNNDNAASRNDVIELGDGIVAGDISLRRSGSTLILSINGTSDSFSVVNFFADDGTSAARIDQVRFKDGTIWTTEILKTMSLQGTTGNDDLTGFDTDDAFSGGAGNDTIAGAAGNDQLSGGEGDDVLNGDAGNDVLFGELGADTLNGGDGDDALSGGDGMDALAGGAGNDTLAGGEGQDFLSGDAGDDVLDAGAGDDQLVGGEGNDQLRGGLGNDVLQGGAGDDRYYFARGDGSDLIWDIDGRTTVYVSQLSLEEIFFRREGTQLVVRFASSAGDEVRLEGFFDPATGLALRGINIDYGTGQVWEISPAALELETLKSTAVNDIIQGNAADNVVLASDGDDRIDGFGGNDTLSGGAGQDVLDGGVGQDTLSGGAGDDLFLIDDGGDTVIEASGEGIDTIESVVSYTLPANVEALRLVGSGNIDATGGSAGDKLYGNSGSNVLTGLAGNDELDGGAGADTLVGGQGDDTYVVDTGNDVVTELVGEGFDTVNATSSYALSDNIEKLVLLAGAYDGTGNSQDNELVGNADDNRLDGGAGADRMAGGEGNDTYVVDAAGDEVVELAGEGEDIVESSINYVLGDTLEHLVLTGTANVNATGNVGNNTLQGNTGNNVLDGAAGADQMAGGAGDDYYIEDESGDDVQEAEDDGIDTIERHYETNYILTNNVENLILGSGVTTGHGNELDNHIVGNSGGNSSLGLEGNDWIQGLGGNDQLFGDEGDDTVEGGTGNDYLEGGDGSDQLEGGDGNDQLGGGTGADTLIGGLGDDKYVLTLDGETDLIDNSHGGFDGIFFEETVSKEQLSFKRDGNDLLIIVDGNEEAPAARVFNHFLGGNYAIDYVQPSAPGSYYLTTAQINAKVAAYGTGYDTVMDGTELADTGGTALVGSSDKDWIRGLGGDDQMFGNSGDDKLQGGAGNDYLAGGLGNDTNTGNDILEGGDGNDTLAGQDGDDTLAGGVGNDTYMWDAGFDTIDNTGGGTDTLFFPSNIPVASLTFKQEGNDLLILVGNNPAQGVRVLNHFLGGDYALDYVYQNGGSGYNTAQMNQKAMAAGFDNVVQGTSSSETLNGTAGKDLMFGGNGNDTLNGAANDDRLLGEAGNDTLYGGAGTDKLEGGLGDDTYTIDDNLDVIVELAGEGNDLVNASVTYALGDNVERLTLTGSAAINGTGNALDNTLIGNSGANTLNGGAGNDTLNGGTGADTLVGGAGNDTYVVDNTGDVVTELANEGTDLVQTSVTYTLSNNVENLTLTGTSAINGTGNALDNVLTGNSGNNTLTGGGGNDTLDGGTGNDTMLGGTGNDTYVVNATGDVVTELAGEGTDLIQSAVTYTLGNNVENLTLTGTSAINATGNTLDNVLTGNSGNNTLTGGNGNDTLDGGAGNDTMVGGTGDDTYFVNTTSDVVTEQASQGTDTVVSGITYTLSTNLEHLTLSGTSAINGTGNASNNRLTGNAGNNALSAAAGDDVLEGGAGTDTLTGGTGKDTYVMARGYGADTVVENDTASGQLDVAKFLSGVSYDQLWFARPSGSNNLEITIIGTGDVLIVKDWYLGSQYRVEEIRTTDGNMVLTAAKVQDLVTAMASLTKPALGQTTLSAAYQTQLASVFASTWTPGGQGLLAGGGRQVELMTAKGIATTAMSEDATAGIIAGGCLPTPRQDRVADWVADIGNRANGDRIQAWLAEHGYASIEDWLQSDARPELPFGHLLDRFRDRQYTDAPAGDTPATDHPWVVGEALPRPELVDGQAMHSVQEWLSTLEQNPQVGADELYQSLVERYAQERTSQSNPVLDTPQPSRDLHADVASNYQRLISAMSLAGAGQSSLAASCETRRDQLDVESSWM